MVFFYVFLHVFSVSTMSEMNEGTTTGLVPPASQPTGRQAGQASHQASSVAHTHTHKRQPVDTSNELRFRGPPVLWQSETLIVRRHRSCPGINPAQASMLPRHRSCPGIDHPEACMRPRHACCPRELWRPLVPTLLDNIRSTMCVYIYIYI